MNGTAIGRRRQELPLRDTRKEIVLAPRSGGFTASSPISRAVHGMVSHGRVSCSMISNYATTPFELQDLRAHPRDHSAGFSVVEGRLRRVWIGNRIGISNRIGNRIGIDNRIGIGGGASGCCAAADADGSAANASRANARGEIFMNIPRCVVIEGIVAG